MAGLSVLKHFLNFDEARACGRDMLSDLKHAVGYPEFDRNNYAAALGEEHDSLRWECLVSLGLAIRGPVIPDDAGRYYYVSKAGLEYLRSLAGGYSPFEKCSPELSGELPCPDDRD